MNYFDGKQDSHILRFELEGIRKTVSALFDRENEKIQQMVADTLESTLTEEWVQSEIKLAVESCVKKAIAGVANNYEL